MVVTVPRPVAPYGRAGSDAFPEAARLAAARVAEHAFDWRVTVQRATTRPNDWGQPGEAEWHDHLIDVPCLIATTASGRELHGDPGQGTTFNKWRMIFRTGLDVTSEDRITDIRDEHGTVLTEGPLNMIGPVYRRAAYSEVEIEAVT